MGEPTRICNDGPQASHYLHAGHDRLLAKMSPTMQLIVELLSAIADGELLNANAFLYAQKSKIKIKGRSGSVVIPFLTGFGRTGGLVAIPPPGCGIALEANQLHSSRCPPSPVVMLANTVTYEADYLPVVGDQYSRVMCSSLLTLVVQPITAICKELIIALYKAC